MTNVHDFAQREFEILMEQAGTVGPDDQPIIAPFIPELLALAEKFGQNGESGGSAAFTINVIAGAIRQLLSFKAICPIAGTPDEWVFNDTDPQHPLWQNKRCPALFKETENAPAFYVDAIVFKEKSGATFTGSVKGPGGVWVSSRQYVNFPFKPKSFYVDVTHTSVILNANPEWRIKDKYQLDKVFEYYRKPVE